ncbi:5-dehydro-4-deoxy-D-glucuronate isomerase [Haloferula sargassicola]
MKVAHTPSPSEAAMLDTVGLRESFLLEDLFQPGELTLVYTDLDRAIVGSAVPTGSALKLEAGDELRADYFCERRELGVLNMGEKGTVAVDGTDYELEKCDCLYIGRGSKEISFSSADAGEPAGFYLISYPAHTGHPTTKATPADANRVELGSPEECNERTICQYIHQNGIRSCQLVMGFTEFKPGSIWNTMPAHTHLRRSEVYGYFDVPTGHAVLHMMGEPDETRPLWIHDKQAVLSPAWSIHCGAGTAAYRFCWAMGGENQDFTDMDKVEISELR